MRNETTKYIVGFLAAVGLIVVVIVLLVRALVSGPGTPVAPSIVPADLASQADTATTVKLTLDSPITAPPLHHDITITVGRDETVLTISDGYNGNVVQSKTYGMSATAYRIFLRAIDLNGFTEGNSDPTMKDERGHCALGDRFIYEVIDPDGQTTQRYWQSTCGTGTFNGDGPTIRQLFRDQVPDYFQLTNNIQF